MLVSEMETPKAPKPKKENNKKEKETITETELKIDELFSFLDNVIDYLDPEPVVEVENPDPIIHSKKAREAMVKIRKWEFNKRAHLFKLTNTIYVPFQRCAQASCLSTRDFNVLTPGPWITCPFQHTEGDEYIVNPLPGKKHFAKRAAAYRTIQRPKIRHFCAHCQFVKYNVYTEPDMYYDDYLAQVTRIRHPNQDVSPAEFKINKPKYQTRNTLMEPEIERNPTPKKLEEDEDSEVDLSPYSDAAIAELRVLLDPKNRASLFEPYDPPKLRKPNVPITRTYVTRTRTHTRPPATAKKIAPVPKKAIIRKATSASPLTGPANVVNFSRKKKSYTNVKSRYMASLSRKSRGREGRGDSGSQSQLIDDKGAESKPSKTNSEVTEKQAPKQKSEIVGTIPQIGAPKKNFEVTRSKSSKKNFEVTRSKSSKKTLKKATKKKLRLKKPKK